MSTIQSLKKITVVECNQCGRTLPGDGSVRVDPVNPGAKFGNGLLLPAAGH